MNESREWIFHPLSTWPVLCNGGGLFRWQVGHISVAYFFFSCHQYLFLLLFYRIAVSWLSYSVSVWSLGQHVCRFSPAIAHLSSFWEDSETYNDPVSVKIYASLLIPSSLYLKRRPYKVILGEIRAKHSASSLKVFTCNFCISSNASLSWLGTSFFPACPPFVNTVYRFRVVLHALHSLNVTQFCIMQTFCKRCFSVWHLKIVFYFLHD